MSEPLRVDEIRNERLQARHEVHAVRLHADGSVAKGWGDVGFSTYLRSSPKPLQAIPFAQVMAEFGLADDALALACASHSGEAAHVALAKQMLKALGLDPSHLACGPHPPVTQHSLRGPDGQEAIHNNCSGKHAGMLAACIGNGWPVKGYLEPDHPLQQRILGMVSEATGRTGIETGIDGCGVPTFWLTISDLARIYQWLERHPTGRTCLDAMSAHPWLVAGTDRLCTRIGEATQGQCIGKVGAAGVYVILHRPSGEAVAVKALSGVEAVAETVATKIADQAGWFGIGRGALADVIERPIRNCAGLHIGSYHVPL